MNVEAGGIYNYRRTVMASSTERPELFGCIASVWPQQQVTDTDRY